MKNPPPYEQWSPGSGLCFSLCLPCHPFPHHPPISLQGSLCCPPPPPHFPVCPRNWVPSSLVFSISCLLSKWDPWPLSSFRDLISLPTLIHYFIVFICLGVSSLLDCGTFPGSVTMLDLLLTRAPSTSRPISAQCQVAEWLNSNAWFQSKFLEYVLFCEIFLQITFLVGHILARGK